MRGSRFMLYLVFRPQACTHDDPTGFVVCAASQQGARKLVVRRVGTALALPSASPWSTAKCKHIGYAPTNSREHIVLEYS